MQVLILHGIKFLYLLQFFLKQYHFRVQNLMASLTYYTFFLIFLLI